MAQTDTQTLELVIDALASMTATLSPDDEARGIRLLRMTVLQALQYATGEREERRAQSSLDARAGLVSIQLKLKR